MKSDVVKGKSLEDRDPFLDYQVIFISPAGTSIEISAANAIIFRNQLGEHNKYYRIFLQYGESFSFEITADLKTDVISPIVEAYYNKSFDGCLGEKSEIEKMVENYLISVLTCIFSI